MKRCLFAAAAVLLMSTAVASAQKTLYRGGAWETYITKNTANKFMCGMKVEGRGSMLTVKYSGGEIFLQLYKQGWNIPKETKIPSWLQFDNSQRFPMIGYGDNHRSGMGFVEYTVETGKEADFLSMFSDASKMILGFDQGTQVPFSINMAGSRDAVKAFKGCAMEVDAHYAAQPQPYGPKPSQPQPYGNDPQPQTKPVKRDDGSI